MALNPKPPLLSPIQGFNYSLSTGIAGGGTKRGQHKKKKKEVKKFKNLIERNKKFPNWINHEIYSLLFEKELYILAYEKIKSKPGNMTKGTDNKTLDEFSIELIEETIKLIQKEEFKFKPSRRIEIPKANGKTRPLGIPSPRDKVVQEVMRLILEAIYEPNFLESSHGFRPNKGCHTALKEIRNWQSIDWFIEADIKGCFDNVDHHILANFLSKRIKDQRFLSLYWKAVRAGYVCSLTKNQHLSIIGVPQGSIISPILSNVYLHELDKEMLNIFKEYTKGETRKKSPLYGSLQAKALRRERKGQKADAHRLKKQMRKTASKVSKDPDFLRVKYVRYADDFIVGIIGPINLAKEINRRIIKTLSDLNLQLNPEKSSILRAFKETKFLGTLISMWKPSTKMCFGVKESGKRIGNFCKMNAPVQSLVKKLASNGFCDGSGKPLAKLAWVNEDVHILILRFNSILTGIFNYYSFVDNFATLGRIQFILQHSLAKTLCNKLKIRNRYQLFKKYGPSLKWETTMNKKTKTSELKLRAPKGGWVRNTRKFLVNPPVDLYGIYYKRYTRSSLNNSCSICNSYLKVEMHHVKHLKKINKKLSGFTAQMAKINRKQIPVCRVCHLDIHYGKYDSVSLKIISNKYITIEK